jgi:hypothetical protein
MVGVIAQTDLLLLPKSQKFHSFVSCLCVCFCLCVCICFDSFFARAYFITGLWSVGQTRK